jgi:DNA polymerase-4
LTIPDEAQLEKEGVRSWPIWTKEESEFPWSYDSSETCYFLEGDVIVTPDGGEPVHVGAGDGRSCSGTTRGPAMSDTQRCILHADMDAFFASVEQRERPELRGRPVAVGGESNRGVVAAASYEARRFGVRSAMPSVEARRLCPSLIFIRGNMPLYARVSRQVFDIFREFSPSVEGLSLDEAFLDLTGTRRLLGTPREVGERLRARVRRETELAVSVGIAPVKMVAKIASALAKPDGLLEVSAETVREFLAPLPVRCVWGVGPVAEERLLRAGFETMGDLARADSERLEETFGDWGLEVAQLARGRDLREVEPYREAVSYSEENTFERDISDREALEATVLAHAENVARRLRRDELEARTVVLKWRSARRRSSGLRGYPLHTRHVTLPEPTDDGQVIHREVRALLQRTGPGEPVRLIGVGVTNLSSPARGQLPLFGPPPDKQLRRRLNRALDEVADRFGTRAVLRGSQGDAERAGLSLQIKRSKREVDE